MNITKFSLLLVVFVDLIGQGLIIPILTTLLLSTDQAFLAPDTPQSTRQVYFGVAVAVFFLSWFLGAAYISRISDMIGRKKGILICLAGAFLGYVLMIVSLYVGSFLLLLLARVVTGFTAGNQPIAQAAMIDLSTNEQDRIRNLGYIIAGASAGLVAGPILGGLLSDPAALGRFASLSLPFYVAASVIAATMVLIALVFQDRVQDRMPLRFEPLEMFLVLWRITERPAILRISLVFFCYMFVLNSFYVFMDNYLESRFGYGTFMNSVAMMIFGLCAGISSAVLPAVFEARMPKRRIVVLALTVMGVSVLAFTLMPVGGLAIVAVAIVGIAFAVGYPTLLSIYSMAADGSEQGWVMGLTTALFTMGAAITSFAGGEAMAVDIALPFYYGAAVAALAIGLIGALWRYPAVRAIVAKPPQKQPPTATGSTQS